jgi:hypothetical protein
MEKRRYQDVVAVVLAASHRPSSAVMTEYLVLDY